jgi:transglutaminase-like putative cysteine protease
MTDIAHIAIEHETRYLYQTDVELAHHLAYLRPLESDGQKVLASELLITPEPDQQTEDIDSFGNRRTFFTLATPHRALVVKAFSTVQVKNRYIDFDPKETPPWGLVAESLAYALDRPYLTASEFVFPSPYVPRLRELKDYALESFKSGRSIAEASIELSARIFQDFEYSAVATEVHTPLLEAFAKRAGVCQDFSHIYIGCLRAIGLAAQYVSGYLLTRPAPGQQKLRGADASHAWVCVYCPGAPGNWLALDPTNNQVVGIDHISVATGRDFGDVSPLRGVIRGGGEHTLDIAVTSERLSSGSLA